MTDDLARLLDELEQAHAAAEPAVRWLDNGPLILMHNRLPTLIAELRRRDEALQAVRELAEELDREAAERDQIADRLPTTPEYHMEINRLVVAAEHQRRCAKRLRRTLGSATVKAHRAEEALAEVRRLLSDPTYRAMYVHPKAADHILSVLAAHEQAEEAGA